MPLIVVAATFVAEPLEVSLRFLLSEAGIPAEISFAPYNQILQQLLAPTSDLARNGPSVSVVLIRLEDFARDIADAQEAADVITRVAGELADALTQFAQKIKGTLILSVFPPSPGVIPSLGAVVKSASSELTTAAQMLSGIHVVSALELEQFAGPSRHDAIRDRLAHIPYTEEYFAAMALAIARHIHALQIPAAKVLVLDCDNTIWRGVVGEDGIDGIQVTEPFLAVQKFSLQQQAKGVLICLASKNVETDVLQVLERRKDMLLKPSHIVAHRINWLSKATNIRSLAAELNLGLDAFCFLDDNPVECAQMRAELPQVVTLQLPREPEIPSMLGHIWNFDKLVITAEDATRTQMYRENAARRTFESSVTDIDAFLASLNIKIEIAPPDDDEWARVEQLMQRTNQFNFCTERLTIPELKSRLSKGAWVLRVRVSDRFGDYGLVGAIVAHRDDDMLVIDDLLLSCRVLGRGVEHTMLRHLGKIAKTSGLKTVSLRYVPSARNVPAKAFADSVASAYAEKGETQTLYQIPLSSALSIAHQPGHDPVQIVNARIAEEKKAAAINEKPESSDRSERYERLACALTSGRAIVQHLATHGRRVRPVNRTPVPPESAIEVQMLALWETVLSIDGIGVEDDFFSLGGTSLISVALFAEIQRQFGVQLRLTSILEASTIRGLARLVTLSADSGRQGLVCLRPGTDSNIFLVHDGLGETLLYLNLARRMPAEMAVYGIEPRRLPGIPLAHATIENMALYYVELIRQVQPHGPYLLGGMCAGGVIAYEMAACLSRVAEMVQIVTILDGATPQAAKRTGRVTSARLSRLAHALKTGSSLQQSRVRNLLLIGSTVLRKVSNTLIYELRATAQRLSVRMRFALMERLLTNGHTWPRIIPELTVAQIYSQLEARYRPPTLPDTPVLLVRASSGDAADTPYRLIYRDADFGWRRVANRLELIDVSGGHSSMLQMEYIDSLSSALVNRLQHQPNQALDLGMSVSSLTEVAL